MQAPGTFRSQGTREYDGWRRQTMGIFDKLREWLLGAPPTDSPLKGRGTEQRYDNVKITNIVDGTTIEGHDAVKAHFSKERQLVDEHGSSIIFQVYRINLGATTIKEMAGEKLEEIKVGGEFVSGTDTVADVKSNVRSLLEGELRSRPDAEVRPELVIREADQISFSFGNRPMRDDKLFYADHFMVLPVWVQVFLHDCHHEELVELARRLNRAGQES
jgi:hypothetical protein